MSASIAQVAALRRLARVYRRILVLAVPAALAGCQGAADSFAPDATAAGDLSPAAAESATAEAVPSSGTIAALATDRIVFSSLTATGSDIWTMSPAGSSATRLTSYSGTERGPRWSWDRKQIAFVRQRNGLADIFVMNADGTNKHWARPTAYSSTIDMPSWSPDGSHLLVRVGVQGFLLAKLDLATGNLSLIAPAGALGVDGSYPVYDPTGKTIFYVDNTLKVIKRFTPGGAVTTVLSPGIWVADLAPSPDGSKLAYDGGATGQSNEIFVLNLATKVVKRLTNNSVPDYTPSWSPDGTKFAFASLRSGGKLQVYTMNSSTGGGVTKITSKTYGAYAPAWTR